MKKGDFSVLVWPDLGHFEWLMLSMVVIKLIFIALIGLAAGAIPIAPTSVSIDVSLALANGFIPSVTVPSTTPLLASVPIDPSTTSLLVDASVGPSPVSPLVGTPINSDFSHHRSSRHYSSRRPHRTSWYTDSRPHHTSRCYIDGYSCHASSHDNCPCRTDRCCHTKTICATINETPCWYLVCPCPTNTTHFVTSTVFVCPTLSFVASSVVAPTSAPVAPVVAPTSAAVAPMVCTPCTNYVTVSTNPPMVCTTMIFCDIVDQSENCAAQNNMNIESIASMALRQGGQVFINGQLVVFENSGSGSSSVTSGSSVVTVTGLDANSAAGNFFNILTGSGAALLGLIFLL